MGTFLIADDSPSKRDFLLNILRKEDWIDEINIAKTSEEAFELIDTFDIDFAFIDYEIPSKNGPAIIRALKKANSSARIALVTASDSPRYKQDGIDAGAEGFVCTSWTLDRVSSALTDLLDRWREAE